MPQCDPSRPPVPHYIQHGSRRCHTPQGDGGSADGGGRGGTCNVDTGTCGLFYASTGIITSTQLENLKRAFDFLEDLFVWVGFRTNTRKTLIMACKPCHMPVIIPVVAYERRATGTGPPYQERQRMQDQCLECGVEVAGGSLMTHHHIHIGVGQGYQGRVPPSPPGGGPDLSVLLPQNSVTTPVPGRGVSGGGGVKLDQPPGSIFAPLRAGYKCGPGGEELNLPHMTQLRHVSTAVGPQYKAYRDRTFPPERGAESSLTGRRGGKIGGSNCDKCLCHPPIPRLILQVPWEIPDGGV